MNRKITVMIDGKRRRVAKREALMIMLIGRALQADPKALAAIVRTEEKFGHLRLPPPKVEGSGVLVVGAPIGLNAWCAKYAGPKELPPFSILDELRAQLMSKDDDDSDKS